MKVFRCQPDNWRWKPTQRDRVRIWIGIACMCYVLAICGYVYQRAPNSTFRLGSPIRLAVDTFGPNGHVLFFALIGTACLAAAIRIYRSSDI